MRFLRHQRTQSTLLIFGLMGAIILLGVIAGCSSDSDQESTDAGTTAPATTTSTTAHTTMTSTAPPPEVPPADTAPPAQVPEFEVIDEMECAWLERLAPPDGDSYFDAYGCSDASGEAVIFRGSCTFREGDLTIDPASQLEFMDIGEDLMSLGLGISMLPGVDSITFGEIMIVRYSSNDPFTVDEIIFRFLHGAGYVGYCLPEGSSDSYTA